MLYSHVNLDIFVVSKQAYIVYLGSDESPSSSNFGVLQEALDSR